MFKSDVCGIQGNKISLSFITSYDHLFDWPIIDIQKYIQKKRETTRSIAKTHFSIIASNVAKTF